MILSSKSSRPRGLRFSRDKNGQVITEIKTVSYSDGRVLKVRRPILEIVQNKKLFDSGTVKRGSATCPVTGYTTPVESVRKQLIARHGGAQDARLYAVAYDVDGKPRDFRLPNENDFKSHEKASKKLDDLIHNHKGEISVIPSETIPLMSGVFNVPIYGHVTWESIFNKRQLLFIITFIDNIQEIENFIQGKDDQFLEAMEFCACLLLDKLIDNNSALCGWQKNTPNAAHVFTRWALPMMWDYAEVNPIAGAGGSPKSLSKKFFAGMERLIKSIDQPGILFMEDAKKQILPDDSVDVIFTDPPYYNAIPYADISDYFYVWLKRVDSRRIRKIFSDIISPKEQEIVEMSGWDPIRYSHKDKKYFEDWY